MITGCDDVVQTADTGLGNTLTKPGNLSVIPEKMNCGTICAGVTADVAVCAEWAWRGE